MDRRNGDGRNGSGRNGSGGGRDGSGSTPAPKRRALHLAGAWTLLFLAGPGVIHGSGLASLAVLGLAWWAWISCRSGPRAFALEFLFAALGWAAVLSFTAYVFFGTLVWIAPGMGLYTAGAGVLLRRAARRIPLALAVPLAWVSVETLRVVVPTPFGIGAMRLGTHLADDFLIAEGARVFGVGGLGWVLAALAGFVADRLRRGPRLVASSCAGFLPLVVAVVAGLATSPPPPAKEPVRVLCVQPNVPQERKMEGLDRGQLLSDAVHLTREGLEDAAAAGREAPDLVCWGETMLFLAIADPGLREAVSGGLDLPPWSGFHLSPQLVDRWLEEEARWVGEILCEGVLPEGTNLLAGAEYFLPLGDRVGRQNAVILWDPEGRRGDAETSVAAKTHLVPSAETMLGLEEFAIVRDIMAELAGYIPDLAGLDRTRALAFETRASETGAGVVRHVGVSVCWDNVYDSSFTQPLRDGPVDFHVVASNEAWFRRHFEMDQMVAYSRLAAIATARSVVRTTNSGVSIAIGPDGRELARLVVDGRDREVRGTLYAEIPVPEAGSPPNTPFVEWEMAWASLWLLGGLVAFLLGAPAGPTAKKLPRARG